MMAQAAKLCFIYQVLRSSRIGTELEWITKCTPNNKPRVPGLPFRLLLDVEISLPACDKTSSRILLCVPTEFGWLHLFRRSIDQDVYTYSGRRTTFALGLDLEPSCILFKVISNTSWKGTEDWMKLQKSVSRRDQQLEPPVYKSAIEVSWEVVWIIEFTSAIVGAFID